VWGGALQQKLYGQKIQDVGSPEVPSARLLESVKSVQNTQVIDELIKRAVMVIWVYSRHV